jgi:hypothetical protein
MIKSKLAVLCLTLVAVTLYASSPADAWVLFPGHRDVQHGREILSGNESSRGPITAILTYTGGYGHGVIPTPGGGAIMAGTYGAGFECCKPWLIQLDSRGEPVWKLFYEADGLAGANNIQKTSDGGYIMSGEGVNMMAVKVDADGNVEWAKNYGEGGYTHGRVFITSNDDYLLIGATALDDDGVKNNGRVLRLDQQGNVLWDKVIGQYGVNEYFTYATVAHNGNNIIAGMNAGNYWVLEIDYSGNVVWQKSYGGIYEDDAWTVTRIRDRFYMVVGSSDSFAQGGMRNWWAIVLTETGQVVWENSFGGSDAEDPNVVIETSDGGAMIGGGTGSFGAGYSDIWLIKFDARGQIQWQKTYGVDRTEHAWHIQELPSGGYVVIGDSYFYPATYDIWLMVIDENGDVQLGDCGEVGDTFVTPIPTNATVQSPTISVIDKNIRVIDLSVDVVEQTSPIEDCTPGGGLM